MIVPLVVVQETASVPHLKAAANFLSTCTKWPLTHLTGQSEELRPETKGNEYVIYHINGFFFLLSHDNKNHCILQC